MTVTPSQLDGYYKPVFGALENAVPEFAVLRKEIPFSKQEKTGDTYNFPVKLTRSHGITWGGTGGTAFTLNSAISMVTKNAALQGSEFVLREAISYGAISRSGEGNSESYGQVMDEVPLEMAEAANFYLEMALLYGASATGIGVISADPGGGGAATRDVVLTAASWAAGLWSQMEGAAIDIFDSTLATERTNSATTCLVTAVNPSTRTISLSGDGGDLDDIAINDVIVPLGSTTAGSAVGNWFYGLDAIATNAGTLFGISAATYNMWRANSYSAGSAPLTMAKIQNAVSLAVVRGAMEDMDVLVSPFTWTDLNNDLAALRRFGDSTKSDADIGTQKITYFGSNGKLTVRPHPMLKAGEAFVVPFKYMKRVGASDVTFRLPGMAQDAFFTPLASQAGVDLRCYFDQALVSTRPARIVKITNITNASL